MRGGRERAPRRELERLAADVAEQQVRALHLGDAHRVRARDRLLDERLLQPDAEVTRDDLQDVSDDASGGASEQRLEDRGFCDGLLRRGDAPGRAVDLEHRDVIALGVLQKRTSPTASPKSPPPVRSRRLRARVDDAAAREHGVDHPAHERAADAQHGLLVRGPNTESREEPRRHAPRRRRARARTPRCARPSPCASASPPRRRTPPRLASTSRVPPHGLASAPRRGA